MDQNEKRCRCLPRLRLGAPLVAGWTIGWSMSSLSYLAMMHRTTWWYLSVCIHVAAIISMVVLMCLYARHIARYEKALADLNASRDGLIASLRGRNTSKDAYIAVLVELNTSKDELIAALKEEKVLRDEV